MFNVPPTRLGCTFWTRLAALLSLLAVFLALVAPVSMLAEEVRTGKLGGICSVNTAASPAADTDSSTESGTAHAGSQCELCGTMGLVLPPLPLPEAHCPTGGLLLALEVPTAFSAAVTGLPFSRGPPAFLI